MPKKTLQSVEQYPREDIDLSQMPESERELELQSFANALFELTVNFYTIYIDIIYPYWLLMTGCPRKDSGHWLFPGARETPKSTGMPE